MVLIDASRCIGCCSCVRVCPMGVLVAGQRSPEIHPGRRCISCMHCAGICPVKAIRFEGLSEEQVYQRQPEDGLEQLIRKRRSIRHYKKILPDRQLIQRAMNTACYAPSGKNQRAYHWTVVWGPDAVSKLRTLCLSLCGQYGVAPELNRLYAKGTDLLTCGAPCMIVVWGPDDCLNPVLDPAVAMTQLELLLVHEGLATCWGGYLRQISDRFAEVRSYLGLPEGMRVRCALMVGYAEAEHYRNWVWRPEADAVWVGEAEAVNGEDGR